MKLNIMIYTIISAIMLFIDFIWLKFIIGSFFKSQLISFELTLRILPAFIAYLLMPLGIVLFVLPRAQDDMFAAIIWGGLLGFIVYGVYDFTNYAVLEKWSLKFLLVDICWGTFLFSFISVLASYFYKVLK